MDIHTLKLLAKYNVWATHKLSESLRLVSETDFTKDSGLFFNSISNTLNHILIAEHYLWFPRFSESISPIMALNTIIEPNRLNLIQQLLDKSKNWNGFLERLDENLLNEKLIYTSSAGQPITVPYGPTLLHVFNHGTHHRGQISAALTNMGYPCPEWDLIYMLLEE